MGISGATDLSGEASGRLIKKLSDLDQQELLDKAVELLEIATPGKRTVNITDHGGKNETYHILANGEEILFIDGPKASEDVALLRLLDPGILLPILKPFVSGNSFELTEEAIDDVIHPIMAEMVGCERRWVCLWGEGDKETVAHFLPESKDINLMQEIQPGDWEMILEYVLQQGRNFAKAEEERHSREAARMRRVVEITNQMIGMADEDDIPF